MNVRVLIGFFAGAVIASLGSYWITHRDSAPPIAVEIAAPPPPTTVESSSVPPEAPSAPAPPKAVAKKPDPPRVKASSKPAPKTLTITHHLPPFNDRPAPKPVEIATAPAPVVSTPPPVVARPVEVVKAPEAPVPPTVTIAPGTSIPVRLVQTLSTMRNRPGDLFIATLDHELIVDGFVIAEKGSRTEGRVTAVDQAGRFRGISHLAVELTRLHTSDGQTVVIHTTRFEKLGPVFHRDEAAIPLETVLAFQIDHPVTITEKLQ